MIKTVTPPSERKSVIRKAFDKSAPRYDMSAGFQREMAKTLFGEIISRKFVRGVALEIGCGTGELAASIVQAKMFETVLAYDISFGMAQRTLKRRNGFDNLHVAQADAEHLPVRKESVDLCFSNLTFQWIDDLPAMFAQAALALKKGGRLMATVLSSSTFHELREAVTHACEQSGTPVDENMFHRFPDESLLINAAKDAGFTVRAERKMYLREFADIRSFMRSLKNIGVQNNPGLSELGLGRRRVMERFDEEYRSRFALDGGIGVTYEVVYLDAFVG